MGKRNYYLISLLIILILSGISFSQTTHEVTVSNLTFSPAELTITVGDIVKWTNVSGTHNVLADDNSFTSGDPAPAPWEYTHTFTAAGTNPYYCQPHGGPGGQGMAGVIIVESTVNITEDKLIPGKFELNQNYPNPFNPNTNISFAIPTKDLVTIKVFDVLGREVEVLVNETRNPGHYEVNFNADALPSGTYIYQIRTGSFIATKKMILLK